MLLNSSLLCNTCISDCISLLQHSSQFKITCILQCFDLKRNYDLLCAFKMFILELYCLLKSSCSLYLFCTIYSLHFSIIEHETCLHILLLMCCILFLK